MDPNLFHIDMGRLFEVLVAIIVLSFFLERALAIVFEHRLWTGRMNESGFKTPIAFIVAFGVCRYWDFDAVSTTILAVKAGGWRIKRSDLEQLDLRHIADMSNKPV